MNINLKPTVIGQWAGNIMLIAAILWFGVNEEEEQLKVLTFIEESCTFAVEALIVTIGALAIVFLAQAIRASEWYDRHGAGTEMAKIRDRTNTTLEKPSDSIACAIQYASTTLLLAVILFGFFLIHQA